MEKNYYEILEVDKNASNEIIEKAYKTLAKRYHPDLQNKALKNEYEEKMKQVNEAYSVLSDNTQRNTYDEQLKENIITKEEYQNIVKENMLLRQEIQKLQNNRQNQFVNQTTNQVLNQEYKNHINRAVNQAYQDSYIQNMRNMGYKIKRKFTIKDYLKLVAIICGIILVIFLLAQIPVIKSFFRELYKNNIIIKTIVDTIKTGF